MSNPYTSQSISGYNASPPPDDGTNTAANEVKWGTHKDKLADPIKTLAEGIDTAALAAFAKIFGAGVTSTGSNYTVLASDQGKLIRVTAGVTITTPAAATEGTPFVFAVKNEHSSAITIDGNGSETIDGAANISLPAGLAVILTTDGTNWFTASSYPEINLGTEQASTSGTAVDFTGIPAGTKRITIMFEAVSLSGTDDILVQIGDSGGFETTGYTSTTADTTPAFVNTTSGFIMKCIGSFTGHMVLLLFNASNNTWTSSHTGFRNSATDYGVLGGGTKDLSAELTQVRITRTGTDTFDLGAINIQYD